MAEPSAYYVVYGPEKTVIANPNMCFKYMMVKWIILKDGSTQPTSEGKTFEKLEDANEFLNKQGRIACETKLFRDPTIVGTWI